MATRRASARQIAAAHRRYMQEEHRKLALSEIARIETELTEILQSWRSAVVVVEPHAYQQQLTPRPFQSVTLSPAAPDYDMGERNHRSALVQTLEAQHPLIGRLQGKWLLAVALLVTVLGIGAGTTAASVVGAVASLGFAALWLWSRMVFRPGCVARAAAEWPGVREQIAAEDAKGQTVYEAARAAAQTEWDAAETKRVARVRDLLLGRLDVMTVAVGHELEGIDVPFDCQFAILVDEEDHALVDVDLPEVEEVIPATRYTAMKTGGVKQAKRPASERNEAYVELVCGIAIAVASSALSAAPTLGFVTVAGRTQRQRRALPGVEDSYVLEVKVSRSAISTVNPAVLDALDFVRRACAGNIQVAANGSLKEITAPEWTSDLTRSPPAERGSPQAVLPDLEVRAPRVRFAVTTPSPTSSSGKGVAAVTMLCGLCVLSALCARESSSTTTEVARAAATPVSLPAEGARRREAQRVAAVRDRARVLTRDLQTYDGSRASTRKAARQVIAAAHEAQLDCETSRAVSEEILAKGHEHAAHRFDEAIRDVICDGARPPARHGERTSSGAMAPTARTRETALDSEQIRKIIDDASRK